MVPRLGAGPPLPPRVAKTTVPAADVVLRPAAGPPLPPEVAKTTLPAAAVVPRPAAAPAFPPEEAKTTLAAADMVPRPGADRPLPPEEADSPQPAGDMVPRLSTPLPIPLEPPPTTLTALKPETDGAVTVIALLTLEKDKLAVVDNLSFLLINLDEIFEEIKKTNYKVTLFLAF